MSLAPMLIAAIPAFLASAVEFVEALTVVLAVGMTRGWRYTQIGVFAALLTLAVLVLAFGASLRSVPISVLQLVVGVLLLFFGMRWLRKAALRYANVIAVHDEEKAFAQETSRLRLLGRSGDFDLIAFATTYKAVVLEGLEVVFIVLAVGSAAGAMVPAIYGALSAAVLVIGAGALVHKPLSRVPENLLKFCVGVMLSAFGTFWTGEGLHVQWPERDLCIVWLILAFGAASVVATLAVRRTPVIEG